MQTEWLKEKYQIMSVQPEIFILNKHYLKFQRDLQISFDNWVGCRVIGQLKQVKVKGIRTCF